MFWRSRFKVGLQVCIFKKLQGDAVAYSWLSNSKYATLTSAGLWNDKNASHTSDEKFRSMPLRIWGLGGGCGGGEQDLYEEEKDSMQLSRLLSKDYKTKVYQH